MSETHDKHFVLILIHVSMAKDNFLWGGIRRYHLKWVAAHLLRPRAPYAEMRHLRGMRQCFGGPTLLSLQLIPEENVSVAAQEAEPGA